MSERQERDSARARERERFENKEVLNRRSKEYIESPATSGARGLDSAKARGLVGAMRHAMRLVLPGAS